MNARRIKRYTRSDECTIELSGLTHECRVGNYTASGALVNCKGFLQETWPGDKCAIHLRNCERDIKCRVAHIAASKIGLQFIDTPD
jgi:hypothetical protein